MKKFLGSTWHEWLCIFVAVTVAELTIDHFQFNGASFMGFAVFVIAWSLAYTLCYILIKMITSWKEKN